MRVMIQSERPKEAWCTLYVQYVCTRDEMFEILRIALDGLTREGGKIISYSVGERTDRSHN